MTVKNPDHIGVSFAELDRVAEDYGADDRGVEQAMRRLSDAVEALRRADVHPAAAEYALGANLAFLLACSPPQHRHVYAERFFDALRKDFHAQCLAVDKLGDQWLA